MYVNSEHVRKLPAYARKNRTIKPGLSENSKLFLNAILSRGADQFRVSTNAVRMNRFTRGSTILQENTFCSLSARLLARVRRLEGSTSQV